MIMANSLGRDLRDVRGVQVLRSKDKGEARRLFNVALKDRDATTVARLSTAVVSPRETAAPLLDMIQEHLKKASYADDDKEQAIRLIEDHLA
jgi:hypothetical protein